MRTLSSSAREVTVTVGNMTGLFLFSQFLDVGWRRWKRANTQRGRKETWICGSGERIMASQVLRTLPGSPREWLSSAPSGWTCAPPPPSSWSAPSSARGSRSSWCCWWKIPACCPLSQALCAAAHSPSAYPWAGPASPAAHPHCPALPASAGQRAPPGGGGGAAWRGSPGHCKTEGQRDEAAPPKRCWDCCPWLWRGPRTWPGWWRDPGS